MIKRIINFLIDLITLILDGIMKLLPDTPFQFEPIPWGSFGQLVGLFIPLGSMALHMVLILTAYLGYYVVRWLLRVIRQVQ